MKNVAAQWPHHPVSKCLYVETLTQSWAKQGQRTPEDEDAGLSCCRGAHGKGICNSNEALIQFLLHHGLFASNTSFEHTSRPKTSWTGWVKDYPSTLYSYQTSLQPNWLCALQDQCWISAYWCHSYGGATLSSDHKPIVARLQFAYIPLVRRQSPTKSKALYDFHRLTAETILADFLPTTQHVTVKTTL